MTTFTTGSFSYQTAVPNTLISSAYFNGTIQNSAIAAQAYTDAAISTVTSETLPLVGGILTGWLTGQSAIMTAGNEASAFVAAGQSAVGFDASGGTFSNGAIRMAQGQYISLEDTSTILMGLLNGNTLEVTSGTQVNLGLSQIGDLVILNSVSSPALFTSTLVSNSVTTTSLFETSVALGSGNNINLASGNFFQKLVSASFTFTVSNVPSSGTAAHFILNITNGGAYTVTWFANIRWANGTAPTLTTSGQDSLGFYTFDGGANWFGFVLGQGMA